MYISRPSGEYQKLMCTENLKEKVCVMAGPQQWGGVPELFHCGDFRIWKL